MARDKTAVMLKPGEKGNAFEELEGDALEDAALPMKARSEQVTGKILGHCIWEN